MKTTTLDSGLLFVDKMDNPEDKLMSLVGQYCTVKSIQDLLRDYKKQNKDILISGDKEQVIRNLNTAVAKRIIPEEKVLNLLSRAEENGRQHIFFYKPKTEDILTLCNDINQIGALLFENPKWQTDMGFPKFNIDPDGFEWADLRQDSEQFPNTWILKIYHGNTRDSFIKEKKIGKIKAKIYEEKYFRDVFIVKWNKYGLLEIRVPTSKVASIRQVVSSEEYVWERILPAFPRPGFERWDIVANLSKIIKSDYDKLRFTLAEFLDAEYGRVRFESADIEDELQQASDRKKAMELFKTCKGATAFWEFDDGNMEKEIRTDICQICINDLKIGRSTTPEAIDYVTSKLFRI